MVKTIEKCLLAIVLVALNLGICLAQPRSKKEVKSLLKDFLPQLNARPQGISPSEALNEGEMMMHSSGEIIKNLEVTDVALESDAFYVFAAENKKGFVIVSADESMAPILGYSATAEFDPDNIPSDVQWWLETYMMEYAQLSENSSREMRYTAQQPFSGSVAPLVKTQWNQSTPYNNLCPTESGTRTVTGCVATAMAQAMSVYKKPTYPSGSVSYTTASNSIYISENLGNYYFDWTNAMNPSSSSYASAVARIMYASGVAVKMDYGVSSQGGSGAYPSDIMPALRDNFGYDNDMIFCQKESMSDYDYKTLLINEFKAGRPVIYNGRTTSSGHCFVLDGYEVRSGEPYFHVNWGWGGSYDGYFLISSLNPDGYGIGGASGTYSIENSAILNFKPENGTSEYEGFWQAKTITVNPAAVMPGTSAQITINCNNCYNYGLSSFSGSFNYYLIDSNGTRTKLGTKSVGTNVGFRYGSSYSFSATLPSNLSLGNYTIEVKSQATGSSKEQPVYCSTYEVPFTVSSTRAGYVTDIQVAGILENGISGRTVNLSIAQILNNGAEVFTGSMKMALANSSGYILEYLENTTSISSLGHWSYLTFPRDLSGEIPASIADGNYRIYLVTSQEGYDDWSKVKQYTMEGGYLSTFDIEAYVPIKIQNGVVSFDDSVLPTYSPDIEVTAFNITGSNGRSVEASVSLMANMNQMSFFGRVGFAIADKNGSNLSVFGTPNQVASELPQSSWFTSDRTIPMSAIPNSYADGEYRLYLVANQAGYKDWTKVSKYVNTGSSITNTGQECYVPIWLKDNEIYFSEPEEDPDENVLASGKCGVNAYYTIYDDYSMVISGSGEMADYKEKTWDSSTAPWEEQYKDQITRIVIQEGITSVGDCAFYWMSNLSNVEFANSITEIGNWSFYQCSKLTSVVLPSNLKEIGGVSFSYTGIESIVFPDGLMTIGNQAFTETKLTSVSIPASVTKISFLAFRCPTIRAINVSSSNQNYCSVDGVLYDKNRTTLCEYPNGRSDVVYSVLPGVKVIGLYAFDKSSLSKIVLPEGLTKIETTAFRDCIKLAEINLPEGITSIGSNAFEGCSSLRSITIPSTVTTIDFMCFYRCSSLEQIINKALVPQSIVESVFKYVGKSIPLYVPAESVNAYKTAPYWSEFTNIQAIPETDFVLTDGDAYTVSSNKEAESITYNRNFTHTDWTSLYIPFSMSYTDWSEDFEVAYINSIDQYDENEDGSIDKVMMHIIKIKGGSLYPNTPYLIKPKTTGQKSIKVYNKTLTAAASSSISCSTMTSTFTFTGTYAGLSGTTLYNNDYYVMSNGKLCLTNGSAALKPYRWYMSVTDRTPLYSTAATRAAGDIIVKVVGEDDGEEVFMYNDTTSLDKSFDLLGRSLDDKKLTPGVYIKNGKKVMIK